MIINGSWRERLDRNELSDSWLLGDAHFETIRTYGNKPFALEAHLERLNLVRISQGLPAIDRVAIRAGVTELIERRGQESGRLRIIVGSDGTWLATHDPSPPVAAMVKCQIRPWVDEPMNFGKSTSYGARFALRRAAQADGYDDAILINKSGIFVEATTCNLIFKIGANWITPELGTGCLPGITRSLLVENFGVTEGEVTRADLTLVEGVALISSLREIQGVESIDGNLLPSSDVVKRLAEDFHTWILGNLSP